jgi:hypothetical protein
MLRYSPPRSPSPTGATRVTLVTLATKRLADGAHRRYIRSRFSSLDDAPPTAMTTLPCVIDIEASGFGRGSYPIEIGFVLPDGYARCTLVRPEDSWTHWDNGAERLHGLTRELLQRYGRPVGEVAALLNEHLGGCAVYCDNWAHDFAWLARLYDQAELTPAFQLRHVRELLDEQQVERWDAACVRARNGLRIDRHRASNDARVLQKALGQLNAAERSPPCAPPQSPPRAA